MNTPLEVIKSTKVNGPNVLLEGPAGTGKTYAIGTLVDWAAEKGLKVNVLFVENGLETLLGYWVDRGKPIPECLDWKSILIKPASLDALIKASDMVGKLSYESLTKMSDPKRGENNSFYTILNACANFVSDRTGKSLGAVDSWGADTIFVIDSLSELSNSAMKMVIGSKPTASQSDFGVAQNNLMNFLRLCTNGIACTFLLIAHISRETDEVTGMTKLMTKAIGRALASEIPQLFSDVIYAVREGTSFYFDTAAVGVDVKSRNLPIASKQPPNLGLLMDKWFGRISAAS